LPVMRGGRAERALGLPVVGEDKRQSGPRISIRRTANAGKEGKESNNKREGGV